MTPSAPRRLRLSILLLDIASGAEPADQNPDAGTGAGSGAGETPPAGKAPRTPSNVTVGEILDRTTHSGFGFLIAFLALAAIPFPGVSFPFGIAIAFGGLQIIAGRDRPWLPVRIRRHAVSMKTVSWIGLNVARWTSRIEKAIRPRMGFVARGPLWVVLGAGLLIQGIGLALPLPIPGSNWVFVLPILVYAIGLLEGDGLLLLVAHAATATEVALGVVFWRPIVESVTKVFGWIASFV
jgi:hypothetical protein